MRAPGLPRRQARPCSARKSSPYRPKPKKPVGRAPGFLGTASMRSAIRTPRIGVYALRATPSPEHSKAYRLGSDPDRSEGGYRYSANVSLTALLTTNGDADLCIKDAADRTRAHRQDRKQLAGSETWAHSA